MRFGFLQNDIILQTQKYGYSSMIRTYLNIIDVENKNLYCACVDFRKALDVVFKNGIWLKIIRYEISLKMITILHYIYRSVMSCVGINGTLSEYFESNEGVKQGYYYHPFYLYYL